MDLATLRRPKSAAHASIADKLTAAGIDPADVGARADRTTSAVPAVEVHDDGTVVAGMVYRLDYRAEEEHGFGKLVRALSGDDPRTTTLTKAGKRCVARFADVNAIVVATDPLPTRTYAWGDDLRSGVKPPKEPDYASRWTRELPYMREDQLARQVQHDHVKMDELRALAKKYGLTALPRKKADLAEYVLNAPERLATRTLADVWPAWFASGRHLVIRADAGASAVIVDALGDAIDAGHLAIRAYSGPFASGIFLYDGRDESAATHTKRREAADWHDARMAELKPVADKLKADGRNWYFLGNPREGEGGVVRYWLNGASGGVSKSGISFTGQPFGWFTLDELRDERFIDAHLDK